MTKHQKTQDLKPEPETETTTTLATLPAVPPQLTSTEDADIAALAAEARELGDDIRIGDPLKFKKGTWSKTIGKDDIVVITATMPFVVDVRSYKRGWIKWADRKRSRLPCSFVADHGIEGGDHLSHDGDDNDFRFLVAYRFALTNHVLQSFPLRKRCFHR
jgi:hypothetical protein